MIIKIIHVTSGVQLYFYKATRMLFVRNENKNNDFIQRFVSSASPYSAILESITYVNNVCMQIHCLRSDQSVNYVNMFPCTVHTRFMYGILSKMAL